jgi:hypothetical protein
MGPTDLAGSALAELGTGLGVEGQVGHSRSPQDDDGAVRRRVVGLDAGRGTTARVRSERTASITEPWVRLDLHAASLAEATR